MVEKNHFIDFGWQRSEAVIIDLALGGFMAQLGSLGSKPLRAYGNPPFGLRGCKRRLRHVNGSGLVDSEPASQDFSVFYSLNFFGD